MSICTVKDIQIDSKDSKESLKRWMSCWSISRTWPSETPRGFQDGKSMRRTEDRRAPGSREGAEMLVCLAPEQRGVVLAGDEQVQVQQHLPGKAP